MAVISSKSHFASVDSVVEHQTTTRRVGLVVPVHNEESAIEPFLHRVSSVVSALPSFQFEFIFINDGSTDRTLHVLLQLMRTERRMRVIDLSRNFGKEAAITSGLDACDCDAAIPIDVDLQDPPELIPKLLEKWLDGHDVVLARRGDRSSDTYLKSRTAALFYRLHNRIASQRIPENVGDFRLLDRRVIDALKTLPERRRFMKGLFAWVGFSTAVVEYAREKRSSGETKFTLWKLWNFAIEGITSFSTVPLEIWTYIGSIVSLFSIVYSILIFVKTLLFGIDVPGYASIMVCILFLGGVQLIGIGVLGQYIGRIYIEIKQRPIYIIKDVFKNDDESQIPL